MEDFAKQLRDMADTAEEMAKKAQEEASAPQLVRTWCVLLAGMGTPVKVKADTFTGKGSPLVFWRNGTPVAHLQGDIVNIWWVEEPDACCCEGACSESE